MNNALIVKIEAQSYSSSGMIDAFREYFNVYELDWQAIRFQNGSVGTIKIWERIMQYVDMYNPSLIFIQLQKSDILSSDQMALLGKRSFVINFTEDVREDISWYRAVAPKIGLTCFTNMDDVATLKAEGIENVMYVPVPYNHHWFNMDSYISVPRFPIVFSGSNYENTNLIFPKSGERTEMVKMLEKEFKDRFYPLGLGQKNPPVYGKKLAHIFANSHAVITHNHFLRNGYCSDRGLCAMGSGALVIHEYFPGIYSMFPDCKFLLTWKTLDDLEFLVRMVLKGGIKVSEEGKKEISKYTFENHSWFAVLRKYLIPEYQKSIKYGESIA